MALTLLLCACVATTPQRAPEAPPPPPDPTRAALAEGEKAYTAGDDARASGLLLPLARNGNVTAQIRLADIYSRNRGAPVNAAESCNWWEAAANQRQAFAANNLGVCHELGRGRPQSDAQALSWYRKAADGGSARGMYNLGLMHENGRGGAQSFEQAAAWFQRALDAPTSTADLRNDARRHLKRANNHLGAARGEPQALHDLAIDLFNGHEPEVKDIPRALKTMREAAVRGTLPEAWYLYGSWLNIDAFGLKSDLPQAASWMRKASDAGHEAARIRYANLLLCGIGVRKDAAGGERVLRQTIDSGSWQAMSELSQWYLNGACGFAKDAALSSQWRTKADAEQLAQSQRRQPPRN